jgi:HKD family nuclease
MIKVLTSAAETAKAIRELLADAEDIVFAYAWMTMSAPPLANPSWLDKVRTGLVGTAFAQTDPEVLKLVCERAVAVRVKENDEGVFHPKVIIGIRGRTAWAVVGSSNFTAGGLRDNNEVNVLLSGDRSDGNIRALLTTIETWYEREGQIIDAALVRRYRAKHSKIHRRRAPSAAVLGSRSNPLKSGGTQLDLEWRDYYERLGETDWLESWTSEMRKCQHYFEEYESLANMRDASVGEPVLTYVAGFAGGAGAFCSTRPAREFKQLITSDVRGLKLLSKYLDKIPAKDEEDEVDLRSAERVSRAVLDRFDGVGLGCWTRLLVVKRPDVFIAVNAGSSKRLRAYFGSAPKDVKPYFELLRKVHRYRWYQSPPPGSRRQLEVWNQRAALLDTIFYTPR